MSCGLGMNGNIVGTASGEIVHITIGLLDHQMDIEGKVRCFANAFDHRNSDGYIRHEMTIHHIDMNPIGTAFFGGFYLFTQPGEVCRQN